MTLELVASSAVGEVVPVGVAVEVAVDDGVGVGVELDVTVELGVGGGLEVTVGLGVAVKLDVAVKLGVTVALGVAVATGVPPPPFPLQPASSPPPIARAIDRATPRCAHCEAFRPHRVPHSGDAACQRQNRLVL
jgi:hypothetical protein